MCVCVCVCVCVCARVCVCVCVCCLTSPQKRRQREDRARTVTTRTLVCCCQSVIIGVVCPRTPCTTPLDWTVQADVPSLLVDLSAEHITFEEAAKKYPTI